MIPEVKMITLKNQEFIIDNKGNKKRVILDYDDFLRLMEIAEDNEDSKLIKKTKNEKEISLEDYKRKRKFV
jgi:hypothetical protein